MAHGAVLINSGGRIESVGAEGAVPCPESAEHVSFAAAAILPGLVNTHTHLELSGFGGPVRRRSFPEWITYVRERKETVEPGEFARAAMRGLRECWRYGVTTVADTGDSGAAVAALTELGGSGVAYQEVFGPHPDQATKAVDRLLVQLAEQRGAAGSRVRIGASPHAPYTVSLDLYRQVVERVAPDYPVAMHLAESTAESLLVTEARGPFAEAWQSRRIPLPDGSRSPVEYVRSTGILDARPLVIHAVQVDEADVAALATSGATVAACPVSNTAHGHGSPPVPKWLAGGLLFGVGTDSELSVGALDLWREAGRLRDLTAARPAEVIEWLTVRGAAAVGLGDEIGTLAVGRWADLCVVDVGPVPTDPVAAVLERGSTCILRTYVGGRCVFDRGDRGFDQR